MDRLLHKCMTSNIDSKNWRKRRLEADEAMEEYREKVLKSHRIDNIRDHDKEYEDYKQQWTNLPYLPEDIYTDASIRPGEESTIITTLRDEILTVATVAVVVTKDSMDEKIPVQGFQLYSEDQTLGATSYNMEMVGLAQATEFTSKQDENKVIHTDSLS